MGVGHLEQRRVHMGIVTLDRELSLKGRMRLATFDAFTKEQVDERVSDNLLVNGGLALLALGLNWALMQNQNTSFGSPYSAAGSNLGDCWGAVGTSSVVPAAPSSQTGLQAEIGRAILSNDAVSVNQIILDFFYGVNTGNGSIVEAGFFAQGGLVQPTLTVGLASGSNYTSLSVTSVVLPPAGAAGASVITSIPTGSTLIIGYGTGQTQLVTTTAPITNGNTTISVTSFNANANYGSTSAVAYVYGTMVDRTTFATPVVKTNTQTALLEVVLTLVSG